MTLLQIYIIDYSAKGKREKLLAENDNLGFEKNKIKDIDAIPNNQLTDFWFDERALTGFWVDPVADDDTQTTDIVFYIGSNSFRTIWTKEKEDLMRAALCSELIYTK